MQVSALGLLICGHVYVRWAFCRQTVQWLTWIMTVDGVWYGYDPSDAATDLSEMVSNC